MDYKLVFLKKQTGWRGEKEKEKDGRFFKFLKILKCFKYLLILIF